MKNLHISTLLVPSVLLMLFGCAGAGTGIASPAAPGDDENDCNRSEGRRNLEIAFEGEKYTVRVYSPGGSEEIDAAILLHGGGGTGNIIARAANLAELAKSEGFAILVPEGADQGEEYGNRWNSGKYDPLPVERDDVAFLDAVTAEARDELCVDRVLGFGFSNGSQMLQRWACESRSVDALATVAGTLHVPPSSCIAGVPLRAVMGTEDRTFEKGGKRGGPGEAATFDENLSGYSRRNECGPTLQERDSETRAKSTCTEYDCETPLVACRVRGLGHEVPNDESALGIDAGPDAWRWFQSLPDERRDGSK